MVKILDTTLRDGNHTVSNKFDLEDIKKIVNLLDDAKVDYIEVGYGYGLSSNKEPQAISDLDIIKTAKNTAKNSKIAVLVFPNKAKVEDLNIAKHSGADLVRIAVQSTNSEPAIPFVKKCKELGLEVGGFLMMAHKASKEQLFNSAKKLVDEGVTSITITDSSGYMTPADIVEKIGILTNNLKATIGFHTHNNLGLAVGNSIIAINEGVTMVDSALRGLGAGPGNTATEDLVAVLKKQGEEISADFDKICEASEKLEDVLTKYKMDPVNSVDSIYVGYYGIYSSFMKLSRQISNKYGIKNNELIKVIAEKGYVPGDEEKIEQLGKQLSNKKIS